MSTFIYPKLDGVFTPPLGVLVAQALAVLFRSSGTTCYLDESCLLMYERSALRPIIEVFAIVLPLFQGIACAIQRRSAA
jgi:hypothetical protein